MLLFERGTECLVWDYKDELRAMIGSSGLNTPSSSFLDAESIRCSTVDLPRGELGTLLVNMNEIDF